MTVSYTHLSAASLDARYTPPPLKALFRYLPLRGISQKGRYICRGLFRSVRARLPLTTRHAAGAARSAYRPTTAARFCPPLRFKCSECENAFICSSFACRAFSFQCKAWLLLQGACATFFKAISGEPYIPAHSFHKKQPLVARNRLPLGRQGQAGIV